MKKIISAGLTLALSASSWAGVHNVKLDTSPDRVKTPLKVDLPRIGTIRPRAAGEIRGQNWRLGCEILDRDYMNFDEYREFVAPLGIRRVRLQGGWAKCEKVKGQYDFVWLDHIVDSLRADGIECMLETSYGNPIYKGGGSQDLSGGFPTSEEALAAWDAWVEALATHFKGRVDTFLMWNEPDNRPYDGSERKTPAQVAAFDIRTAKVIRRVIPDAHLAGLSLATGAVPYFEQSLAAMGGDAKLFDTMIYHGYAVAPESSYEAVEQKKAILAKYNPAAKLWQGENGCPSEMRPSFALSKISWSEYSQAKWDMRRMLGDLGHDVLSSVYTICDFNHINKGQQKGMNNKGLVRANEDREVIGIKRAYYAVQNVASVFDDTLVRVKDSRYLAGFGCGNWSLATYHYVKEDGSNLFVFWSHGFDGKTKTYERPGDSFETHPETFTLTGEHRKAFRDPVWVDLLTGRVYAFPKEHQVVGKTVVTFINVPVYDSPCILTERSALPLQE